MTAILIGLVVVALTIAVHVAAAVLIAYLLAPITPWSVDELWLPVLAVLVLLQVARRR